MPRRPWEIFAPLRTRPRRNRKRRLTVPGGASRDPPPRCRRALSVGSAPVGLVFDIVDLERETQAAASWRWSFVTNSTLTGLRSLLKTYHGHFAFGRDG
jgi:hypothetical protein